MSSKKWYLYLSDAELSVLLHSLVRLKNSLMKQNRHADCVDELILKVVKFTRALHFFRSET